MPRKSTPPAQWAAERNEPPESTQFSSFVMRRPKRVVLHFVEASQASEKVTYGIISAVCSTLSAPMWTLFAMKLPEEGFSLEYGWFWAAVFPTFFALAAGVLSLIAHFKMRRNCVDTPINIDVDEGLLHSYQDTVDQEQGGG